MNLTKNIITRAEALALCPSYVAFVEGDFDKFSEVDAALSKMRKGRVAITARKQDNGSLAFFRVKVSSVNNNDPKALDGPVVRVNNDEATWRVDGDKYAFPLAS